MRMMAKMKKMTHNYVSVVKTIIQGYQNEENN